MYYGGRGISVCREWRESVVAFVQDMGSRPTRKHQLDRIDNDKGYSPSNCRWVEKKPQMRNTRISKRWFINGVEYPSLKKASDVLKTPCSTIQKWCNGRSGGGYTYPPKDNCWSEKVYG